MRVPAAPGPFDAALTGLPGLARAPGKLVVAVEVDRAVGVELPQLMFAADVADSTRARAHDERVSARPAGPVPHASDQFPVRDPGGREERVIGGDQVIRGENPD